MLHVKGEREEKKVRDRDGDLAQSACMIPIRADIVTFLSVSTSKFWRIIRLTSDTGYGSEM
jgi:hypothetical protein